MGEQAARLTDPVQHPLPPVLSLGPGSQNVFIGNLPAWRGISASSVPGLQAAKQASDIAITAAEVATLAAVGTPGFPAAKANEEAIKAASALAMAGSVQVAIAASAAQAALSGGVPDQHACVTPLPLPPHGNGVVIDGSQTVFTNGLPACRKGDTIIEPLGPPNRIALGHLTTYIGD